MILADTSVWIDHLRKGNPRLSELLREGEILVHPMVIGELACGNLKDRTNLLAAFHELPGAIAANDAEAMHVLGSRRLWGLGLGWVDVHLIAAALLTRCGLWTLDARLARAAQRTGVACV